MSGSYVRAFADIGKDDIATVGGKAANLGELVRAMFPVPPGFVVTVDAYQKALAASGLAALVRSELAGLDHNNTDRLNEISARLTERVRNVEIPGELQQQILAAYRGLDKGNALVAVRSSATAEDTPRYSFAGMFETFLNVTGEAALLAAVRGCWASTFGARVLFYRLAQGLPADMPVAAIVQRMVDSDKSGVIFTSDPTSQARDRIVVEAAWGLGEVVVGGQVTPDNYVLSRSTLALLEKRVAHKEFLLKRDGAGNFTVREDLTHDSRSDAQVLDTAELTELGELARRIDQHYGTPQDVEFAVEGRRIFITQARPITTLQPTASEQAAPGARAVLVRGLGASPGRASGAVRILHNVADAGTLEPGAVLVARMTAPDWVPLMRRASAIVTDSGGMTSHAAIVSRELGLPCVVGARNATEVLKPGMRVAVDGHSGVVTTAAAASPELSDVKPVVVSEAASEAQRPVTATRLYVNLAEPDLAESVSKMDVDGIGLLRAEFMMVNALDRTHPKRFIAAGRQDEFVRRMADQLRVFAGAFHPRPVVYRSMDFRTNEFRGLAGGEEFEPQEANPMIGYRGCFRYTKDRELFSLELRALLEVRNDFDNLHLMIPFVRTLSEFAACKKLIDASGLMTGRGFELWVMAEVPSIVYWLAEYARLGVSGVSIGSNDLTQLVLGVDRDNELLAPIYDERDPAVLHVIREIIEESHRLGLTCSICGQAPSVYPEYAEMLVRCGIDSVSVNSDAIESARHALAVAEKRVLLEHTIQSTVSVQHARLG